MNAQALQTLNVVADVEKHLRKKPTGCLCPSCTRKAIRSHSLQRNGWLSAIAEKGHVVGVCRQIAANLYQASPASPPPPRIDRIGLVEASTFWGYCNQHDTELFECIERHPLQKGNVEQLFALHLRALSYERVAKRNQLELFRNLPEMAGEVIIQGQMFRSDSKLRWDEFWHEDKYRLFEKDYSYEWILIPKNIGVASVTMIPPLSALVEDRYMTAHRCDDGTYNVARPAFSLSVIPEDQNTHVVMCWHNDDGDLVAPWRRSLCTDDNQSLSHFLNKCIFAKSEDYYLRPSLWETLSKENKENLRWLLEFCGDVDAIPAIVVI